MSDPTTGRPASLKYRAHTAGLDPDYWYPAAQIADLRPGSVKEVVFWKTSIALYRDADGSFHALENRCAHRHLRLSEGKVAGPHLVCRYHGWSYDGTGRLAHVSHEITGRRLPKICVASYPVREKYGLVWIFPGDRARAEAVPLPAIHELDDGQPCEVMPIVMTLRSHHAMIVENVCDFNHEMLHEGFHPFAGQKLTRNERVGDTIHVGYDTTVGTHGIVSYFTGGATTEILNHGLRADLERSGVRVSEELREGELSRRDLSHASAVFVRTEVAHSSVTWETNALRDVLYASMLPRHLGSNWFANSDERRLIERRNASRGSSL